MAGPGHADPGPSSREEKFEATRLDRDRTLAAVHRLETALAMAAGGADWSSEVVADLDALAAAMEEERSEFHRPDSLLSMIAEEHPRRFRSRIRNLAEQYDDVVRQVVSLRDQLAGSDDTDTDVPDVRRRAGWLVQALHHCRARQTDLVYEALEMDLGER